MTRRVPFSAEVKQAARAVHRLPVVDSYRPPRTRGECIDGTEATGSRADRWAGKAQCLALRCRHNLLAVQGEDRPGRRNDGKAPPWTVRGSGDSSAPSCALDVADQGPHSAAAVGEVTGKGRRRVQQEVRAALLELRARGADEEDVRVMLAMVDEQGQGAKR